MGDFRRAEPGGGQFADLVRVDRPARASTQAISWLRQQPAGLQAAVAQRPGDGAGASVGEEGDVAERQLEMQVQLVKDRCGQVDRRLEAFTVVAGFDPEAPQGVDDVAALVDNLYRSLSVARPAVNREDLPQVAPRALAVVSWL